MTQSNIEEWMGGFFDAEGSVELQPHATPTANRDYNIRQACKISHCYVAGLFDGDGSLSPSVKNRESQGDSFSIEPTTRIPQENTQPLKERLEVYSEEVGLSYSLYDYPESHGEKDYFVWAISELESVEAFLRAIEPHIIVKEVEVNIMLEEIIPRIKRGFHLNRRGFLEIVAWKDIMDSNKGGARGKYNLKYFEDKWDMELDPGLAGIPCDWEPDYTRPQQGHTTSSG